jgi:hypothetical protein
MLLRGRDHDSVPLDGLRGERHVVLALGSSFSYVMRVRLARLFLAGRISVMPMLVRTFPVRVLIMVVPSVATRAG